MLPAKNIEYSKASYWDERYEHEESYEWYKGYGEFKHLLQKYVNKSSTILMLGCGNSSLSEEMYHDGYEHIVNSDISPVVIQRMANKSAVTKQMEWVTMDMTDMKGIADASFDVVIEKGTLDALLVGEKDLWNVSEQAKGIVDTALKEVSRVLRPSGHFLSITFAQPHFRQPLYASVKYDWDIKFHTFGNSFHYYFYVMSKGKPLTYVLPSYITSKNNNTRTLSPCEDMFLDNIDIENL